MKVAARVTPNGVDHPNSVEGKVIFLGIKNEVLC